MVRREQSIYSTAQSVRPAVQQVIRGHSGSLAGWLFNLRALTLTQLPTPARKAVAIIQAGNITEILDRIPVDIGGGFLPQ